MQVLDTMTTLDYKVCPWSLTKLVYVCLVCSFIETSKPQVNINTLDGTLLDYDLGASAGLLHSSLTS